jgi:YggT family protein
MLEHNILHQVVTISTGLVIVAMFVRFIASWFQIDERYAFIRLLAYITDPFIVPVRRIIKPVWVLDLSFFVVWFMLNTLQYLLWQALPPGW